jgi:hypothetical protein
MDDAAAHLTSSYGRLDEALAKSNSSDPRIATLRTLLAFVGKIDPRNARVLPEQLAAFVSHVVDGTENKLGQIVRALAQSAAGPETATGTPPQNASFANAAPAPLSPSGSAAHVLAAANAPLDPPPDVSAHVAERLVAMDHDVKAALLSLVQSPPRDMAAPVMQALSSALGATTALQLNVLSAQSSDPNAMSIPLPLYFFEGGKPAQLRIDRDAPQSGERMDADNFHVSFVLDTKTMGTVAIDLRTVGRAVTLNVKTERTSAADRFRGTLSDIRGRLEALRYRVAAMAADVAAPKAPLKEVPAQAVQRVVKTSNVDARA